MYPINIESLAALCTPEVPHQFATVEDLVTVLEPVISEVEAKLKRCEAHTGNEGDGARNEL
ncbi:MAG TPA: hypothetical protein VJ875_16290 [Pyrinomonadaceae bacterium]|nr:hypothetical protein [Pyrinomonadaceae bacterium]